jgi:hypothetical protein
MRKIDELVQGMTKEEVLDCLEGDNAEAIILEINGEEYACPKDVDLEDSNCRCTCEECWREVLLNSGIQFKDEEVKQSIEMKPEAYAYHEVEKSGIDGIELVMENALEMALRSGSDVINLQSYGKVTDMLNETQVRQLSDWLLKVISYIDNKKIEREIEKHNPTEEVKEVKTIVNKEELEKLVNLTIVEK